MENLILASHTEIKMNREKQRVTYFMDLLFTAKYEPLLPKSFKEKAHKKHVDKKGTVKNREDSKEKSHVRLNPTYKEIECLVDCPRGNQRIKSLKNLMEQPSVYLFNN